MDKKIGIALLLGVVIGVIIALGYGSLNNPGKVHTLAQLIPITSDKYDENNQTITIGWAKPSDRPAPNPPLVRGQLLSFRFYSTDPANAKVASTYDFVMKYDGTDSATSPEGSALSKPYNSVYVVMVGEAVPENTKPLQ
ncbi:MAG: hypothetical protein K8R88_03410 [Armatimonadetes bacterium]|nr:hypothetical protein [Armatimonadota bacterium]